MEERQTIDVFVSYSSLDRARVRPIVEFLKTSGLNVWWDSRIAPGAGFDAEIQNALDGARCVLVIWSDNSVTSEWVITEASEGLERGILVPVSIDESRPPLAFRRRQTISVGRGQEALATVDSAVRGVLEGTAVEFERAAPTRAASKVLWGIGGLISGALIVVLVGYVVLLSEPAKSAQRPETMIRASFLLDGWEDYQIDATFMPSLTMSADGDFVVYVARDSDGSPHLRYRRLDSLESAEINGTQGGVLPFLSPDDRWLGFLVGREIRRVPIEGGTPSKIISLEENDIWGASWGEDGRIVYAEGRSGLKSVSVTGEQSQSITELDHTLFQGSHRLPHHITGTPVLLYCVFNDSGDKALIHEIWALNRSTGETKYLADGVAPHYVSSGHIAYAKPETGTRGTLWASPFDVDTMQLTGIPVALQSGVAGRGGSAFAVGNSSALVYMPDQGHIAAQVMLREADGSEREIGTGDMLVFAAVSDAGHAVAFGGWNVGGGEDTIRVFRLNSGAVSSIARGSIPLWGPGDKTMTYIVRGKGIVRQQLDGDKRQELLDPHPNNIFPQQWLDGGQTLLFTKVESGQATSIDTYTLTPGNPPVRIQGNVSSPAVSSNKRWIAFCTWPAGVYVADFPELRARTQVSETGCTPKWGANDEQLFYQNVTKLLSVDISLNDGVVLGERKVVADLGIHGDEVYDVHRSGRLVYVRHRYPEPKPPVVVSGWQRLLQTSPN